MPLLTELFDFPSLSNKYAAPTALRKERREMQNRLSLYEQRLPYRKTYKRVVSRLLCKRHERV
jgi:hypothetical protein